MKAFIFLVGVMFLLETRSEAASLELIRKIPHSGYSEGLEFHENTLWNATPTEIRQLDPQDGSVLRKFPSPTKYSESVTWFKGLLWNVSWSDDGIYAGTIQGDQIVWKRQGTTPESHAWGILYDGKQFVMTGHESANIYFVSPKTLKSTRSIATNVSHLEDLAWDGKWIWSSAFQSHRGQIFPIHPKTGAIPEFFDLPEKDDCPVIDGIAFDGKNLWVTGKQCPSLYLVKLPTVKKS